MKKCLSRNINRKAVEIEQNKNGFIVRYFQNGKPTKTADANGNLTQATNHNTKRDALDCALFFLYLNPLMSR